MVARLYLPNSTVSAVSPAYDSSWHVTSGAVRRRLVGVPSGQSLTATSVSETSATPVNMLLEQLVSDPLTVAKTISGTFKAASAGRSSGAQVDTRVRFVVRVVSNNGLTIRGTLATLVGTTEIETDSSIDVKIVEGIVTPVAAQVGDRIVVERGFYMPNTSATAASAFLSRGDAFDAPDTPWEESLNTGTQHYYRPWVEFSQDDIWEPVVRRASAIATEVLADPSRTTLRVGGVSSEALVHPDRTPLLVGGVAVEVLQPLVGQTNAGLFAAGFPNTEPRVKLPDGRWVPLRPRSAYRYNPKTPVFVDSSSSSSLSATLSIRPKSGDLLVLMTSTSDQSPKAILDGPSGIPGAVWEERYREINDRHVVWFGLGATDVGTAAITTSLSGGDRSTSLFLLRRTNPVLTHQDQVLALTGTLHAPTVPRDAAALINISSRSLSSPAIEKTDQAWVTLSGGPSSTRLARINPLNAGSTGITATDSIGVSGQLIVVGGTSSHLVAPSDPPLFPTTTRLYVGGDNTSPIHPDYSSEWNTIQSHVNMRHHLSTIRSNVRAHTPSKPSVRPNSGAAFQAVSEPLSAGILSGSYRFLWPVGYGSGAYIHLMVRVMSYDGGVDRGFIINDIDPMPTDSSLTPTKTRTLSGPMTDIQIQRGDRLVLEAGLYFVSGLGGSGVYGGNNEPSTVDYEFLDDLSADTTKTGWFEIIPN